MACLGFLLLMGSLLLLLNSAMAQGEHGIVHVVTETWSKDYCVLFSSDYVSLPRDLSHAPLLPLYNGTEASWCPGKDSFHQAQPSTTQLWPLHRTTAMVMKGNCSVYAKGWLAQGQGAHGLIIVSQVSDQQCSDVTLASQDPHQTLPGLTIPVAVLRYTDMLDILRHTRGTPVHVAMYAPLVPVIDYNLVVIFVLAVGTVAVGGYWAGLTEAAWLQQHQAQGGGRPGGHHQPQVVAAEGPPGAREDEAVENAPVDFTPAMTGAVVTLSCSIMFLLYYFYDHLVYIVIGIFGLGAITGLYSCLAPLAHHLPLQRYRWSLPGCQSYLQLSLLLLASLCTLVTLFWVTYRNEDQWAWLLQDMLGLAYCLFILQHVRLPTLKNCTSLLLALLAMDVFFVFVTPLFTQTGRSIMVEVALGQAHSSSHERLPLMLKVPQLSISTLTSCDQHFSILGFGDIVVPGFLINYCHRFDVHIGARHIYFVACTMAYAVGLLVTFIAMVLMEMGQPALLYLVSSTLLTSLAVAAYRQELILFWTGWGRAQTPDQPIARLCGAHMPSSKQNQEGIAHDHPAVEFEGATNQGTRDLHSNSGENSAKMVIFEDEDTSPENSEGSSDANLEANELPLSYPSTTEDLMPLMPVAMLISLMPPASKLGRIHAQAQAQAHDAGLPWRGLHKKKGLKIKKNMSTQAPL
ncbi:signal peptide peptidase-like 2C [Ctenodactylus gundi]